MTEQHSETTLTATAPSPSYITPSDVVTVIHSSPTPTKPGGLYYFAVDDGVTHWLDEKAPPTGARLVTSSTVVIVSPMPTSQLPSSASGPIPTFWTLTLTNFYTEVDAVTVSSNPTDSIKASTKTYSRLGLGGWNSSTTTSQQNLQSADLGSSVAYGTTKTVFANSTQSVRTNENSSASRLQRRQVGALVIATIEGQVVSWTNEYQGEHEATLVSSAIVTSKTFQSALTVPGSRFKVADSHSIYKCLPPSAAPISSVPQNTGELSQAASSVLQTPIISSSVMGSIIQTDVFASTTETLVPVYSNPTPSLAQTTQASLNASTTHPGFPTTTSSCPGIDRFTVDVSDQI